jgi:uncharacterized membrane protein
MFEALFKYPREAFVRGEIVFTNVVDERLWIAGTIVLAVAIAALALFGTRTRMYRGWQRSLIGLLQASVAVVVVGMVAGPHLSTTKMQAGANTVAVLLDESASMSFVHDPADDERRYDVARALAREELAETLSEIGGTAKFAFAEAPRRVDEFAATSAEVAGTELVRSIETVLQSFRGSPLGAVVVLSDGSDNDTDATAAGELASYGVPIHTIGLGPPTLPGETVLRDVSMAADAPPHSFVTVEFAIEHDSSGSAVLQVRDGRTLLAQQTVALEADSPIVRGSLSFASGAAGIRELTFSLTPPEGDRLVENNTVDRLLTVSQRRRSVLYLEGEPRWEYKFIRRALAGDDVIDLASWLKTTQRKSYRQGVKEADQLADGFPTDKTRLYAYDLVILGSLASTALDDEQHEWLEAFVAERGGSLLALAGRDALADGGWDARPLARVLPVTLERKAEGTYQTLPGKVAITREGYVSPLVFSQGEGAPGLLTLPELRDVQEVGELKPAASTLLEFRTDQGGVHPLLVTQPYGLGTSAVLATATTWRWQMSTPVEDERHSLFWRQLTRQLAETAPRPKSVDLAVDGEEVEVRAWVRDEDFAPEPGRTASAKVTRADRTELTVPLVPSEIPGLHVGRFSAGDQGVSRVDVNIDGEARDSLTRFVQFGVENREFVDPVQNESLLRRIAETTGGQYWRPDGLAGLRDQLSFSGAGIRTIELLPLWSLPALFLLLVLLKLGEWGLRRMWGGV